MKSLSSVGLGLSIVFGCLLLALVGELYYLIWWKRRFANKEIGDGYSSPARELFFMFCLMFSEMKWLVTCPAYFSTLLFLVVFP